MRSDNVKPRALMIQGTMSNVGKSLVTAGLCRVFSQDGYRVSPFKSQNMALNSFITEEGLEMGRAQVVQAEAAGRSPDVRMNPILLKPTNNEGSQVIVNGKVRGVMTARDYFVYKHKLIPDIMKAFKELEETSDLIIIEGAGSPAEINLKKDDIVNMGMAKMASSPVLLVGDIDRGGVFAQLLGTVDLLEEDERNMVKGIIINKFRGDRTILEPGIRMLEERAGIPVLGVVPYSNVDIEDEDSLGNSLNEKGDIGLVDIVAIRLPRISNFTDFNALRMIPGVSLRYCRSAEEIGCPDMVIIPGSKNTIGDLLWMRQNGMEASILKLADRGSAVCGICGGYQMLGRRLSDPYGVETGGDIRGMELLPVETVFAEDKTRTRVSGHFMSGRAVLGIDTEGLMVDGYEIHMGQSEIYDEAQPLLEIRNEITGEVKLDGAYLGNVFGTYVHGIFDGIGIADAVIRKLAEKKGISLEKSGIDYKKYKQTQYDLLADELRNSLDIEEIKKIIEAGIQ